MMMSPDSFLKEYEKADYFELLKLKNELVQSIAAFENDCEMKNDGWKISPGPDVQYQWNLEVLGKVAGMLQEAFNREYEMWGKSISDYYKEMKIKYKQG